MSVSEFAQRLNLAVGVLRTEDGRTRDKIVGTRHRCALDGRARNTAVHLNDRKQQPGWEGKGRIKKCYWR